MTNETDPYKAWNVTSAMREIVDSYREWAGRDGVVYGFMFDGSDIVKLVVDPRTTEEQRKVYLSELPEGEVEIIEMQAPEPYGKPQS